MAKQFTRSQLQAIADALGDTSEGLTGSEIARLLATCRIADTSPEITKRHRLFNAFVSHQNEKQNRTDSRLHPSLDEARGIYPDTGSVRAYAGAPEQGFAVCRVAGRSE